MQTMLPKNNTWLISSTPKTPWKPCIQVGGISSCYFSVMSPVGFVTDCRSVGAVQLGCFLFLSQQWRARLWCDSVIHSSVIPSHSMRSAIYLPALWVAHLTSPSILPRWLSTLYTTPTLGVWWTRMHRETARLCFNFGFTAYPFIHSFPLREEI